VRTRATDTFSDLRAKWSENRAAQAAEDQAREINRVMSASAEDRLILKAAITSLTRCSDMSTAMGQLSVAETGRQEALSAAKALKVNQLPGGDDLKYQLVKALSLSQRADVEYLDWGQDRIDRKCSKGSMSTSDYKKAIDLSKRAGAAKAKAGKLWEPIAQQYGYELYGRDEL
jgi:hypothetical protein